MLGLPRTSEAPRHHTATESLTIVSEAFDQIRCGTVTLSVPLEGDVIQVGARDAPEKGMLCVRKRRRTVTVERTDGKPLQVAIVHQPDTSTRSPTQSALTTSLVFPQPVQILRLGRRRNAKRTGWDIRVIQTNLPHPQHLKQFLDTIGTFGSAKQRGEHRTN